MLHFFRINGEKKADILICREWEYTKAANYDY